MTTTKNILEIRNLTKTFPGVVAVDKVDMDIRAGEVHVLVGENGAGKSTLVKILSGVYHPEQGTILYEGSPYVPRTPHDAILAGIRVVYQEFNLLSFLSVAENIFFEEIPTQMGLVNYPKLYADTRKVLAEVGLDISPRTPVENLGVAQTQLIEIAKAISSDSKVLIMDEPTATLTPKEISTLFEIIEKLKQKGVTIIYISHRLDEIYKIGDRVTVLRNGERVGTEPLAGVSVDELVRMMVGKEIKEQYLFRSDIAPGEVLFEVKNLRYAGNGQNISFTVRRGEILGIAGLVGSGRTEAMRAVFGADPKGGGDLTLKGREITVKNPGDAVRHGIGLLTEDRKLQGLILEMPCYANITITDTAKISKAGLLRKGSERSEAQRLVKDLDIRTPSVNQLAKNLSGGNQQKLVIAKWLFRNSELLIFDEPTRGIDVGAKYEIYTLLWDLAAQGKGIIVISSDLPELLGICHRMLVFSKGKVTGQLDRNEFDPETILALAYQEHIKQNKGHIGRGN